MPPFSKLIGHRYHSLCGNFRPRVIVSIELLFKFLSFFSIPRGFQAKGSTDDVTKEPKTQNIIEEDEKIK